MPTEILPGVPP